MIALTIPIGDVPNSNTRGHWSATAKRRALMRWAVGELARECPPVMCPAALTLTFIWPDKRRRDLDNFEAKGWIDGMVDGRILPDDDGLHLPRVTRELGDGRGPKGTVTIVARLETIPRNVPGNGGDVGSVCDNGTTNKIGPNVTGAQTPQSGPNALIGGADMNSTRSRNTTASGGA